MLCDRGGGIPDTVDGLRTLPGVGDYTAAAIASIAFNRPEAAVDGNVARVLARLFGVTEDVRTTAGKSRIRGLARSLLPARRPGDFNQAWMDLGSRICTPRAPDCQTCPLRSECVAGRSGNAESFPVRDAARTGKPKEVSLVAAVFVNAGKFLVARRPTGGLWSGLWEFPTMELPSRSRAPAHNPSRERKRPDQASPAACKTQQRLVRRLARENRVMISGSPTRISMVRHRLTHRSLFFHVYASQAKSLDGGMPADVRWVSLRSFQNLPVSTAHRRIFSSVRSCDTYL
jgi:adenine-specific DNA glycosylase